MTPELSPLADITNEQWVSSLYEIVLGTEPSVIETSFFTAQIGNDDGIQQVGEAFDNRAELLSWVNEFIADNEQDLGVTGVVTDAEIVDFTFA